MTSAATLPSCVALWASIGSPTTSPIAWMCGTFVRSWPVDGDEAALVDLDARGVGADRVAVRAPADGDEHAVERLRARRAVALERHAQPVLARLDRRRPACSRWIAS